MRSSGILMPISALPSPYGVGTLGQSARDFVSFLVESGQTYWQILPISGQTYWQILPISPTGFGDSPYQSFSSFAGNPYFIDLDDLAQEGLLLPEEFETLTWGESPTRVDYGLIYHQRFPILRRAVARLSIKRPQELADFCRAQQEWLEPYAQFMAFKGHYEGAPWSQWPDPIRLRQPQAVEELAGELAGGAGGRALRFHSLLEGGTVPLLRPVESPERVRQPPGHLHHRGPAHLCGLGQR